MAMKTYFVCSDIHGFYGPLMQSLSEAGFDVDNDEHVLIVLGDIFDRGKQPLEVYRFLRGLPLPRRILVRGNHEALLRDLVERRFPLSHDLTNMTFETLLLLMPGYLEAEKEWERTHPVPTSRIGMMEWTIAHSDFEEKWMTGIYDNDLLIEILQWIYSDEWVDYAEIGRYVFVHAFIPKIDIYDTNWREAGRLAWEEAAWCNPWKKYRDGYFKLEEKEGKVLVCGHWHTSDFYNNLLYLYEPDKRMDIHEANPIFRSELCPGLIGLDACTVYTDAVNVLVLHEEEM